MKLAKEKDDKEMLDQEEEIVHIKRGKKRSRRKKESYEKKSGRII